ncbi:saccharopine dehydrogenase NADP-binding domain-containing protein [Actinosynnema sp. NPDC020468]|uniref:saccharopine dehydrogenase family protein n=1 Tax=Actinosynnema sp. NPDC020468 TaxID=3154488 RepID=UPI00340094D6
MYDVVLLGATGFTGALTAEHLARHVPAGARWALAGRSAPKLAAVAARLGVTGLDLIPADVSDPASLRRLASSTRVLVSTVGPYLTHGMPVVAACAEAGTDYLDLTGEPEFVDRVYVEQHARAVASGARLVHSCGFDSVPYDLGAFFTVSQLPSDVPIRLEGYVTASAGFSGGTLHSAVNALGRLRASAAVARERRALEGRGTRVVRGASRPPHYDHRLGVWALPAPTIDPLVVLRSARASAEYGPDFRYGHHIGVKGLATAVGLAVGAGAVVGLAQLPVTRKWLLGLKEAGDGPSAEQRARSWFKVVFFATAGDERLVTEVAGGDPGYGDTAKMLAESALCLAFDTLAPTAGQVTPAIAMGSPLITRLAAAGITFTTRHL